jgi:putative acetyltransferase
MHIRLDDLNGPEIRALLEEHLADMRSQSPPESVHALDLERLRQPDIRFWTCWSDTQRGSELMGCGALKRIDAAHAEIKSMRSARRFRGQGVGRLMLQHLLQEARAAGYQRLSLETGSEPGFVPARALYAAHGFEVCGPFEGYWDDPNSVFMTRLL